MPKVSDVQTPVTLLPPLQDDIPTRSIRSWNAVLWQFMRFGIVGMLNTVIDVVALNLLLWRFPTHNANLLLFYNSVAYTLGALNSFGLNKYWTFKHRYATTSGEIARFAVVNIAGILCSDGIIWMVAKILHPLITSNLLWANASKGSAILGTMMISYCGMRLWVFAKKPVEHGKKQKCFLLASSVRVPEQQPGSSRIQIAEHIDQTPSNTYERKMSIQHSLAVILPAHNEEAAIAGTVHAVLNALTAWMEDFEVIVVNDGSQDSTRAIVAEIAARDCRVRLINHEVNRGYGAALVSGFAVITKELAFFMDSDGQFDIHDLERFFPFIDKYDAVLGYRVDRQDTWMRKVNAWGWKMLVRLVFGLRVRDVDCAFKLYPGDFFRTHQLETRGAMINTEILYKFTRAGYTYTQLGVHHLPRKGGKATGAKPAVIARAFREMFVYAWKWRREGL